MYIVQKDPTIYLIHHEGDRYEFSSLQELANYLTYFVGKYWKNKIVIGDSLDYGKHYNLFGSVAYKFDYVIIDSELEIIPVNELKKLLPKKWTYYWGPKVGSTPYDEKKHFRSVPISSLPKKRRYRVFKHPKHIQEKRWAEAHREFVRPKRNVRNLPDPWNDEILGVWNIKNWKRYRKTQYKLTNKR